MTIAEAPEPENEAGSGDSDDAPIGPGAEEEAFIASEQYSTPTARVEPAAAPRRDEPPPGRLEDLVARIPANTQKTLHDLLRAKFTRVRRLREGELR